MSANADTTQRIFNEALCQRLKTLRKERGYTQSEMAKLLGISEANYQKYESRSPLPHYLVDKVSLVLGVNIQYLLTGEGPKPR